MKGIHLAQGNIMHYRSTAARLQRSLIGYSALGIILISGIIATINIIPFYLNLRNDVERNLVSAVRSRALAVEQYISRVTDVAAQITSRTQIRNALVSYNQGDMSREELIDFSQPRLADALASTPGIAGLVRFDRAGVPFVYLGTEIPPELLAMPDEPVQTMTVYDPVVIGDAAYLVVHAPIVDQSGVVGTDVVMFDMAYLQQILADSTGLGTSGETFLVGKNPPYTSLLPISADDRPGNITALLGTAELQQDGDNQPGIVIDDAHDRILVYDRVAQVPWALVVVMDIAELYAPVNQQIGLVAGVSSMLLLAGTISLAYLLRPLTGKVLLHTDELAQEVRNQTEGLQAEVAEHQRTEAALRESRGRYQVVSELMSDYAYALRVEPDGSVVREWVTDAYKRTTGFAPQEIDALGGWEHLIHSEDAPLVNQRFKRLLAGQSDISEFRITTKDGRTRWLRDYGKPVWDDAEGRVVRIYGAAQDVTERRRAEAALQHQVLHDALTGLPNRTRFMQMLEQAIRDAQCAKKQFFAVLFLDVDDFKVINDSLGHLDGDLLLITIGNRLEMCLRAGDTIARFGGDEFVILLEHITDIREITALVEQIQKSVAMPIHIGTHQMITSVSIGVVLGNRTYEHPADLLRDADTALHAAKALGIGRYEVFDTSMHDYALRRLHNEAALRQAIDNEEFRVYYQPIVDLSTRRLVGFEALVRWYDPQRGLVPPDEFIPLAEKTGLIVQIGWVVLRKACHQMRLWREQFPDLRPLTISVNLSGREVMSSDLVQHIQQILQETELDPGSLKLEITESIMVDHAETTIAMLNMLRDMGIQLSIDDFGTGYSSLRYLHRFPIHTLKIDRSFISMLHTDDESQAITQSIVALSHTLGMDVIAEGIETDEQLAYLRGLGCDYGQGYLFAQPVEGDAAASLLETEALTIVG
jgi:diguanylate cyclase (GGDEF)-like protein/PAS domain S-box-containing protein